MEKTSNDYYDKKKNLPKQRATKDENIEKTKAVYHVRERSQSEERSRYYEGNNHYDRYAYDVSWKLYVIQQ